VSDDISYTGPVTVEHLSSNFDYDYFRVAAPADSSSLFWVDLCYPHRSDQARHLRELAGRPCHLAFEWKWDEAAGASAAGEDLSAPNALLTTTTKP
jgi:hypothetical protein